MNDKAKVESGAYFDPENPGWGLFVGQLPGDELGLAGIAYVVTDDAHCEYPNFGADGVLWMPEVSGLPGATTYTGTTPVGRVEIVPAGTGVLNVTIEIESAINRGRPQFSPSRPYPYRHTARLVKIL